MDPLRWFDGPSDHWYAYGVRRENRCALGKNLALAGKQIVASPKMSAGLKTDPALSEHNCSMNSSNESRGPLHGIGRFFSTPWSEKVKSIRYRWLKWFPVIPLPVRLP